MHIIAIAAVDKSWGIGLKGKLLVSIPDDMKFFRETTTGHTVVYGRKTLESFPGKRPLPNRRNVVFSRNIGYNVKDAEVVHNIEEFQALLKDLPDDEEVYICGGGAIYRELLPLCDVCYITKIDYEYEADTYFPDLTKDPDWDLTDPGEEETYFDICYEFLVYRRKSRWT